MRPLHRSPFCEAVFCVLRVLFVGSILVLVGSCAHEGGAGNGGGIDLSGFYDSAHHWYDIRDEERVIDPLPDQQRYDASDMRSIAENILLFQKLNGGWAKNYDMTAVLSDAQKAAVLHSKADTNAATFDNGATHSQVNYLAKAFERTGEERYAKACRDGIEFILSAQYKNGGWPQYFPDKRGYRKYITFNDGAMIGVMTTLHNIVRGSRDYSFVETSLVQRVQEAFSQGIECIVRCQIQRDGIPTVWCQQHDQVTFRPQNARTFEPAAASSMESADIVLFLMSLEAPSASVIRSVERAVDWFEQSAIAGIRVDTIEAPKTDYMYHTSADDRVVVKDSAARPIWARFYELESNRPLFANRDGNSVYSLAEVERERRTGYAWYTYAPARVVMLYPQWKLQRGR